ncbi:MAG: single-stranded-DNA-specific exonuclease [Candidatus Frackibacter sp. T328-2]|nr:MAG: single-stranded-DNA-specific exonuclease [Candidatus Frackibacter sp. T328-2]
MILDKKWQLPKQKEELSKNLSERLNLSKVMAEILVNRGLQTEEEIEEFLHVDLNDLHSPFLFRGMKEAVERILQAISFEETIAIYGDYDVDGITSTSLLINFFRRLNAEPKHHIPNRIEEGYGLNKGAIKELADQGVELLITVDCGISDYDEVEYANELGIDVIITDHHEVPDQVPNAKAVINAKQDDCNYPFPELCGVGVAFKLIHGLAIMEHTLQVDEVINEYLDLVTLGTIADIVPLQGENRIIVKHGLDLLRNPNNLGVEALIEVSDLEGKEISTGRVGYILAPKINAAGRIGDPDLALSLLITERPSEAREVAQKLDELNRERKDIQDKILHEAELMVEGIDLDKTKVLVLASEGWHSGIVGIVASEIVEKYYRPTIMIAIEEDGIGKGSARSIKGLNIYQAIKNSKDLLPNYGGHEQAAGLSIAQEDIVQFRKEINQYAEEALTEEDLVPKLRLDAEVELSDLDMDLVEEINSLAPFGLKNPRPKLAIKDVNVANFRIVGNSKKHLKLMVSDDKDNKLDCIGFNLADFREKLITQREGIAIAGSLEINEWKGNKKIQLNLRDINLPEVSFVDRLFARSDEIIANDYYRGIGDADKFYTKVVGVTFENRQEIITELRAGEKLKLVREPDNEYDESAIKVENNAGKQIGYLNANLAQYLAPYLDLGFYYQVNVSEVTGGGEQNLGVNIFIRKEGCEAGEVEVNTRAQRARLQSLSQAEILEEIRSSLIGEYDFRPKQQEALNSLFNKKNTLAIFGTGRGKSAIFQSFAALKALDQGEITIVLYPLRALVNDQFEILQNKLNPLGLQVYKANGSLSVSEREELMTALQQGDLDILLTTPEFLEYHLDKFLNLREEIGFLVVDESHHIGLATNSFRSTYKRLGRLITKLDDPLTLAVTATANDQVAQEISQTLSIDQIIVDPHIRSNLKIVDQRNCNDKDSYLRNLLKSGEKSIIYVNSREKSVEIASKLREEIPALADKIAFYNAGLTNKERNTVENMFRNGELKIIVSTSAFGEGINIPDIRNVILYHLNFNLTEFNQQSGRVGRDGEEAKVHLLFEDRDVRINEFILDSMAPERDILAELYRVLKMVEDDDQEVRLTNQQLADEVSKLVKHKVRDNTISAGLGILEELNLLTRIQEGGKRIIQLEQAPADKLDLNDSLRYQEGQEDKDAFKKFKKMALNESAEKLLSLINKPIYPTKLVKIKEED